jgi:hypothetical protein
MNFTDAKLVHGFAEVAITDPNLGTFTSPWAFSAKLGEKVWFEVSALRNGKFGDPKTMMRDVGRQKDDYDLLDIEKRDWLKSSNGRAEPITQEEAEKFRDFLKEVKEGRFPVTNEFDKPVNPEYLSEIVDFMLPRITLAPSSYIEGATYVNAKKLGEKLYEPRDLPPSSRR